MFVSIPNLLPVNYSNFFYFPDYTPNYGEIRPEDAATAYRGKLQHVISDLLHIAPNALQITLETLFVSLNNTMHNTLQLFTIWKWIPFD